MSFLCSAVFMLGCYAADPLLMRSAGYSSPVEFEQGFQWLRSDLLMDVEAAPAKISTIDNANLLTVDTAAAPYPLIRIFPAEAMIFYAADGKKLFTLHRDGKWEPGEGFRNSTQAGKALFQDICQGLRVCGDAR